MSKWAKLIIVLLTVAILVTVFTDDAQACQGDEGHAYAGIGIGKAGTWLNDNPEEQDKWEDGGGNHALLRAGYRTPIFENWLWLGAELGHHSTFDKQPPEPELDYLIINVEARFLP